MLFGAKEREKAAPAELFAPERPAEIARPAPVLPSSAANISFDSMLFLQSEEEPALKGPTAAELFLQEIQKDPIERMREQILEALGLTEEGLAQLPPDERRGVEEQISAMIEERLRQSNGADRAPETQAEALMQSLKA
ncbi:MAG TPA: hypothetical protein PLK37_07705 [Terricaulis sp.]|nr:hypothetical protein [Terricaulis sp.]